MESTTFNYGMVVFWIVVGGFNLVSLLAMTAIWPVNLICVGVAVAYLVYNITEINRIKRENAE